VTQLETERLVLREPEQADLDALAEIFADPETMLHLGGYPRTRDQVQVGVDNMIRHWRRYEIGLFILVRKVDDLVLGRVGFLVWDPAVWANGLQDEVTEPYETELGWTVGRAHWGQGYAPEAAMAARAWIFAERDDLTRLISLINLENRASIRVAEKLGASPGRIVEGPPFTGPTCVYEHPR
jgi:RimJ/RimL family protein N-acetyltransferase